MNFAGFGRQPHAAGARHAGRSRIAAIWNRPARWPAGGVVLGALALALGSAPAAQAQAVTPVFCSQAALATAIADAANGDTLSLAPFCTYTLTDSLPAIGTSITIRGNHATIQRSGADGTPAFSILTVHAAALSITQVTLSNGDGLGGAIFDAGGPLTVTGSTFSDNSSGGGALGGAIFYEGSGQLSVNGSRFSDNRAAGVGGAIFSGGGLVTVAGSAFSGNSTGGYGGAIVNVGGTLIVTETTFRDNAALGNVLGFAAPRVRALDGIIPLGDGGAILSAGVLIVGASTFTDNLASVSRDIPLTSGVKPDAALGGGEGGAIFSVGSLTVTNSAYTGNSAATLFGPSSSSSRISRGPDVTSSAGNGGGIFSAGHLAITGSMISMSAASGQGGGVYNLGVAILSHSHVQLNSAEHGGGGIFNDGGTVTLHATTVALNHPDNCESLPTTIAGCLF